MVGGAAKLVQPYNAVLTDDVDNKIQFNQNFILMKACEQGENELPTTAYRCRRHLSATIYTFYTKTTLKLLCRTIATHMALLFNKPPPTTAGRSVILLRARTVHR